MFHVYVLWSEKLRKRYVGSAEDVLKRLNEHNTKKTPFTKSGIPWQLIYSETFPDRSSAIKRERFLKTGQGRKFLNSKLLKADSGFSAEG